MNLVTITPCRTVSIRIVSISNTGQQRKKSREKERGLGDQEETCNFWFGYLSKQRVPFIESGETRAGITSLEAMSWVEGRPRFLA